MKWLLFVWLLGTGQPENGWLSFETRAQCEIKRAWYLQRLTLNDGSKAKHWVAECLEVSQ